MDYRILLVIGVTAILGYLMFAMSYIPDEKLGWYDFVFEYDNDVDYLTVVGGSHNYFNLQRSLDDKIEYMTIRNDLYDEPLIITIYENGDPEREFTLHFDSLNEEKYNMLYLLILKEISLFGISGTLIMILHKLKTKGENKDEHI